MAASDSCLLLFILLLLLSRWCFFFPTVPQLCKDRCCGLCWASRAPGSCRHSWRGCPPPLVLVWALELEWMKCLIPILYLCVLGNHLTNPARDYPSDSTSAVPQHAGWVLDCSYTEPQVSCSSTNTLSSTPDPEEGPQPSSLLPFNPTSIPRHLLCSPLPCLLWTEKCLLSPTF